MRTKTKTRLNTNDIRNLLQCNLDPRINMTTGKVMRADSNSWSQITSIEDFIRPTSKTYYKEFFNCKNAKGDKIFLHQITHGDVWEWQIDRYYTDEINFITEADEKLNLYNSLKLKTYNSEEINKTLDSYNNLIKDGPAKSEIDEDTRWRYIDKFGMCLSSLKIEQIVEIEGHIAPIIGKKYSLKSYNWDSADSDLSTYLEDRIVGLSIKWAKEKTDLEFESFLGICYNLLAAYE